MKVKIGGEHVRISSCNTFHITMSRIECTINILGFIGILICEAKRLQRLPAPHESVLSII